jgi:tetratricopeptide (TPR) repeat protein
METQTQYREDVESAAASMLQSASLPERAIFRKEGEYWTVGCGGNAFRLKDSKGLGYLAHLLLHPGAEFHVLDLAGGAAGETGQSRHGLPRGEEDLDKAGIHTASLGDAGEMLDEQAKAAYRRRLSELREELTEAKELGKVERAEKAEQEMDALTAELSRAVGLGGRNRRAASAAERARQSIAKTIKSVVERIAQSDARLGEIFSRCIKTGNFCSYEANADFPIAWEFDAATIEQAKQPAASGEDAPAPADHPQISPAVLEVSPFSFAERTAFVGRESERGTIRAAIDRARAGHGSVVMLAGGAGVGKTRLAMEMAEYASSVGFRRLVGHCYERDEAFPFLPFAEIIEGAVADSGPDFFRRRVGDNAAELAQIAPSLRRIFQDIPQPFDLPPAQKRRHLFQSVSDTTARAAQLRPQLYILEDLHWADESSLGLLIHLANRVAHLPVMIIGTYRDGYMENNHPLVRTLEELIRMGVRPLKLGGLTEDAIAQMLHGMSQRQAPENLVRLIFEESQGYPFFVEEVYRHLVEEGKVFDEAGQFRTDIEITETDVPESVRLIIGRRLKRFDADEMRVLAAAAVIGRSFSFELLTAVCEKGVDELFAAIEKAQQMGIIVPSAEGHGTQFTFAHELVRQTLLAGISAPRLQQLHARVADKIEALYHDGVNERAGEIADHLLKAESFGDSQRLLRFLTLAGKSALDAAAFEEAQQNLKTALSLQGAVDSADRADLLANLAIAESGLERWEPALGYLRESLEVCIRVGDSDAIGRSFSESTDALILAGRFQEAIEVARRGLAHLEGDVSVSRVRLLDGMSRALASADGYEPAHHVQTALKQAESSPNRLEQAGLRRFHAMMLAVGDREKAQTLMNGALRSYTRIGMPCHVEMTQTLRARAVEG